MRGASLEEGHGAKRFDEEGHGAKRFDEEGYGTVERPPFGKRRLITTSVLDELHALSMQLLG